MVNYSKSTGFRVTYIAQLVRWKLGLHPMTCEPVTDYK